MNDDNHDWMQTLTAIDLLCILLFNMLNNI